MTKYNATVRRLDALTGEEIGVFVAEVDDHGKMLRSSAIQFSGFEGTPQYYSYLRRTGHRFEISRDGGEGFRRRLRGLDLPPAYRR